MKKNMGFKDIEEVIIIFDAAACMSMEMAEFGKPFITSIINGYDMVPTLSAASVHDFIHEVLELVLSTFHGFGKYVLVLVYVNGLIWYKVSVRKWLVLCSSWLLFVHSGSG